MPQEDLLELPCTMHERRDENAIVLVNSEGAQIEHFVMERTERDSIGFGVWPTSLVPPNVRCLQSDRHVAYAEVESAEGTAVFVGG